MCTLVTPRASQARLIAFSKESFTSSGTDFGVPKYINYKSGVINDPLGQPTFPLDFEVLGQTYRRTTCVKICNYRLELWSALWINSKNFCNFATSHYPKHTLKLPYSFKGNFIGACSCICNAHYQKLNMQVVFSN